MVSTCPMRRSGPGATGSGRSTRTSCAVVVRGRVTNGTPMRCSSRSTAHSGTCGARSTSTARCSTFWSGRAETRWPQGSSSADAQGLAVRAQVIVTDKLASYQVAHRELLPSVQHRRSKYLNNRAENSHQPTRHRERAMKRFTSIRHAQRFLSAFSGISPHFRPRRHLLVGGRLPTGDGRPLRGLERDHRGDDHGCRLNRRLGQDVSSKPTAYHPESSHRPIRLAQVDNALPTSKRGRTSARPPVH